MADTIGFNDKPWLDWNGHSHTEMMHVVERYHRPDSGHLELEMTVADRGALKASWLIKRTYILDPKEDILENICLENEKDLRHLVSKYSGVNCGAARERQPARQPFDLQPTL